MATFYEDAQTNGTAIGNAIRALEAAQAAGEDVTTYIAALHTALTAGLSALCEHHGWTAAQIDSGGTDKPPQ